MPSLSVECICMNKMLTNRTNYQMIYQYAIVVATSEISAIEGIPLVSVGVCQKILQGLEICHFGASGALIINANGDIIAVNRLSVFRGPVDGYLLRRILRY